VPRALSVGNLVGLLVGLSVNGKHAVAPKTDDHLGGHCRQLPWPGLLVNIPGSHRLQRTSPASLKRPRGHAGPDGG
jgi:hypothetical protein